MIVALTALAFAGRPPAISTDHDAPTRVWLAPNATAWDRNRLEYDCTWKALDKPPALPAGARGTAVLKTADCGEAWVFVRLDTDHGPAKSGVFALEPGEVTTRPPRNTWDAAPVVAGRFVGKREGVVLASPLDVADWTEPLRLGPGEPLEVLDATGSVVRTSTGREAWLWGQLVDAEDPTIGMRDPDTQELRKRWLAGRSRWEKAAPLRAVPHAESLAQQTVGTVWELKLDARWLSDERFADGWLDPVGQVLRNSCTTWAPDAEPCGTYELDYTAFGAWWPRRDTVIAALDGTAMVDGARVPKLRVLVIDPWGDEIRVAPAWDR